MSITEHHVEDHAGILPPAPQPQESGSLLSAFQRKRQEISKRGPREERKLVPQWDGALRIVYRYPEDGTDRVIRAVERATESKAKEDRSRAHVFNANVDVLIACCYDIEFRDPDTGEWAPLDSERRTRFTQKLAEHMQLELPERLKSPARFIARHVFSPKAAVDGEFDGDVGLLDQAGEVLIWLRGADERIDEDLRGE